MARILGKIDDGTTAPQFFIHCNTADASCPPLFATQDAAWKAYETYGVDRLNLAMPTPSRDIKVIKKYLATSSFFEPESEVPVNYSFGLATADRLLFPLNEHDIGEVIRLMVFDGEIHLAVQVSGGFDGDYHAPVCNSNRPYSDDDRLSPLSDHWGKPLSICPHCIDQFRNTLRAI